MVERRLHYMTKEEEKDVSVAWSALLVYLIIGFVFFLLPIAIIILLVKVFS